MRIKLKFYAPQNYSNIWVAFSLVLAINFCVHWEYSNYKHVPVDGIKAVLYKKVSPNLRRNESLPDCVYDIVLENPRTIHSWDATFYGNKGADQYFDPKGIEDGGYMPEHCKPLYSVAILATVRDREWHAYIFLRYMHDFLRKQNIHYKIYLIEQKDSKPFNRGLLYNLGARQAIADRFPCLILHDIDLLPLDDANFYVCANQPRHMSASLDKHRFVLLYEELIGGVLAIRSDQYEKVDGFSNRFWNWGGEDDDFYCRLRENNLTVIRFPRHMSRYTMLRHCVNLRVVNPARMTQRAANRRETPAARALDGMRAAQALVRRGTHRLEALLGVHTDVHTDDDLKRANLL